MYEELDQLDTEKKSLISTFVKVEADKILLYKSMLPRVPEEYWIFLSEVGYVHKNNLVGKAQILFFSSDPRKGSIFLIWKWNEIMRFSRLFKKIK